MIPTQWRSSTLVDSTVESCYVFLPIFAFNNLNCPLRNALGRPGSRLPFWIPAWQCLQGVPPTISGHNDPRNASSVITDVCENNFESHKDPIMFYNTKCEMSHFVDDTSCQSSNNKRSAAENTRESGILITNSLDEVSLKAHGEKTVQVLIGSKDFIKKTKTDLQKLPTKIQDFNVRVAKSDKLHCLE